jgi:hypothetical protein
LESVFDSKIERLFYRNRENKLLMMHHLLLFLLSVIPHFLFQKGWWFPRTGFPLSLVSFLYSSQYVCLTGTTHITSLSSFFFFKQQSIANQANSFCNQDMKRRERIFSSLEKNLNQRSKMQQRMSNNKNEESPFNAHFSMDVVLDWLVLSEWDNDFSCTVELTYLGEKYSGIKGRNVRGKRRKTGPLLFVLRVSECNRSPNKNFVRFPVYFMLSLSLSVHLSPQESWVLNLALSLWWYKRQPVS